MLKLYKITPKEKKYWETWDDNNIHTIHWGELGTPGELKEIDSTLIMNIRQAIQKRIDELIDDGYVQIKIDEHAILLVEYSIHGFGSSEDLSKRHNLEKRMNETLGWTGLGHCDGGSIGNNTMEVCCYVVDFNLAKSVIEKISKALNLKITQGFTMKIMTNIPIHPLL